jgi:hypothetical protein
LIKKPELQRRSTQICFWIKYPAASGKEQSRNHRVSANTLLAPQAKKKNYGQGTTTRARAREREREREAQPIMHPHVVVVVLLRQHILRKQ